MHSETPVMQLLNYRNVRISKNDGDADYTQAKSMIMEEYFFFVELS